MRDFMLFLDYQTARKTKCPAPSVVQLAFFALPASDSLLLMLPVVLLFVDPLTLAILLARYLPPFLRCQGSAIGLALRLYLVVNGSLLLFEARRFTRREGTILYSFPYPLLLVPLPLVDRVILRHNGAYGTQQHRTHHHTDRYCFHVQLFLSFFTTSRRIWTLKRGAPL
jgi:hypothetical protein